MRITHSCGAWWTGQRTAHCGGCHRTFSGMTTFDAHRSQEGPHGTCIDPETLGMVAKVHKVAEGEWIGWGYPSSGTEWWAA